MPAPIGQSVVVVTGASSGIGRATCLALARRGASVALAARSAATLEEVAGQCREAGGAALAVPTDVADEEAVQSLAHRTNETFGRIDAWVNAAAVMAFGTFEEIPSDIHRRVIETNLFGQIFGVRAALPYFRRQGHGVIVNVASVWGAVTSPYVSPYVISKFGVRALSECLHEELLADPAARDIHVCTIMPQSVDTPIFEHAANYAGRQGRPVPPILDPDRVVAAILSALEHPRSRSTVGLAGRAFQVTFTVAPALFHRIVPYAMRFAAFGSKVVPANPGNVWSPMPEQNDISGEWRRGREKLLSAVRQVATGRGA